MNCPKKEYIYIHSAKMETKQFNPLDISHGAIGMLCFGLSLVQHFLINHPFLPCGIYSLYLGMLEVCNLISKCIGYD